LEVIPLRQVAGHWNVLKFLEQGPCTNCVSVTKVTPNPSGTKSFDVQIKHPFKTANLTGFDVRGIAMFHGGHSFPASVLTTPDRATGDGELVNADGYTTLYNSSTAGSGPGGLQGYLKGKFASQTLPDATLNGYKRHISSDPANTRNAFYADDAIIATYELDMPDTQFIFGYAVDACWVPPTTKPVTDPMTQFPPEANCSEPWKIGFTEIPLDNPITEKGGTTKLQVDVYDWQGKDSHLAPKVECSELFDGLLDVPWKEDGPDYTRYEVDVSNSNHAAAGNYKCLVSVEDNDNQGSPDYLDLTAYQIISIPVIQNEPPVAIAEFDATEAVAGKDVSFCDGGSYDPDGGGIVLNEWDWNNDGIYDDQGTNQIHSWGKPGTYQVQYRVTDGEGSTDILDTPLEVEVRDGGWARTWGSNYGNAVTGDSSGNAYVTGAFQGTVDFDPGSGVDEHTSNGAMDIYLSKFDPNGNLLWTKTWGGFDNDYGEGITVDDYANIYLTGSFMNTVDFDPGPLLEARTSNGDTDAFVSMFDTDGNFQWVDAWGGNMYDEGTDISSDGTSLIYVTGRFCSIVDFDPSGNVDEHIATDASDVFLVKLYNTGFYYWVRTWGDLFDDSGCGVAADGFHNAYVTGLTDYAFLYKYAPDGDLIWSKDFGGGLFTIGSDVAVDGFGTAFVTGAFEGTDVDFDPGPGDDLRTSNGGDDIYLSSYDPSGTYLWTKTCGGTGDDHPLGVAINIYLDVYIAGEYEDSVDFDPGAGSDIHVSNGNEDAFLCRFDMDGLFAWARTWGGTGTDDGEAVGTGQQLIKNAFVTGYFSGTVDFDPGSGVDEHTATGGLNAYLSKFLPDGSW
jgi:hypothetical protein